ncbi:MAG: hypothetical protein KIT33_09570 [Candidatus Kapabacteria bacterium]|nr:hypothetical protein [Ignavibacteriota bacterium]MCW5885205.1 hypothetical protein [Candidatus Kapabacteria bacterium]
MIKKVTFPSPKIPLELMYEAASPGDAKCAVAPPIVYVPAASDGPIPPLYSSLFLSSSFTPFGLLVEQSTVNGPNGVLA